MSFIRCDAARRDAAAAGLLEAIARLEQGDLEAGFRQGTAALRSPRPSADDRDAAHAAMIAEGRGGRFLG
jgi:hypothetical protein